MPSTATATANTDHLVLHLPAARKLARYLVRNNADAEDVVQEAYLRALRYSRNAPPGDSPGWMLTIVRNVGFDWIRRARKASPSNVPLDPDWLPVDAPSPEAILLGRRSSESIRKSVDRLPDNYRSVVILRYMEQMPYKDIARRAGIPIGTVMSRLARGRAKLRVLLSSPPQGRPRK